MITKRKGTFIVITDWMTMGLDLKGTELYVFAMIYGFSQAPGNWFTASIDYIIKRSNLGSSAIYAALKKLVDKGYIIKQEVKYGFVKYCRYRYNDTFIDNIINNFEGIEDDKDIFDPFNYDKNNHPIVETIVENTIMESNVGSTMECNMGSTMECNMGSTMVSVDNNKYNNKINNKNIINTRSAISSNQNIFDKTMKEKQKEEKETKKKIKNKTELLEKVSLDDITTEKISDIDNLEVQKNREAAIERAARREASKELAMRENVKKARLNEAKKLFTNPETLKLLGDFLESYQYSYNPMSPKSWEIILDRIVSLPEDKLHIAIKDSIAKNYRMIVYNEPYKKPDFDNTRNHEVDKKALHELTEEERLAYDTKLARNADGSYMVF